MKIKQLTSDILSIYDKVPKQYQLYTEELSKKTNDILELFRVLEDKHSEEVESHNKLIKTHSNLKYEYNTLLKEYEKLNKKLNNELIK